MTDKTEPVINIFTKEKLAEVGITQEKYDSKTLTGVQKHMFEQYLKSIK